MSITRRALVLLASSALLVVVLPGPASAAATTYDVVKTSTGYSASPRDGGEAYRGTLKFVVERASQTLSDAGGGTVRFGSGTYDLGASWFELEHIHRVAYVGAGMDATLLRNSTSASTDTEPFDVKDTVGMSVRDMSVSAGGPDRSTSDALDFDAGNQVLVENVKVLDSRGRGIVFDGKGVEDSFIWTADDNVVRNCVISGVPGDGVELLASSRTRVEGCTISGVGGHGIQIAKASGVADQPNKKSNENVLQGNRIDRAGLDGINLASGDDNQLLGNVITNSGQAGTGHSGLRLTASDGVTAERTVVKGNSATDTQVTKTQQYGVDITGSNVKWTRLEGNDLSGNKTGELRDRGTGTVLVTGSDTSPPQSPPSVAAHALTSSQVDVSWGAASDDVGVVGYRVYRDGAALTSTDLPSTARSFSDTGVVGDSTYTYTVDAADAAGNRSAQSSPVQVTTSASSGTVSLTPSADAYVSSAAPTRNYGAATSLRVDADPEQRSYVRFAVPTVQGDLTSAKLRLHANSGSSAGHAVRPVSDDAWNEAQITFGTAPAVGDVHGVSGPFPSGASVDVDVTALVRSGDVLTLAVTGTSATGVSYGSRESGAPPQLVITYGVDEAAPSVPSDVTATATAPGRVDVAWTGSTDDNDVAGYGVYRDGTIVADVGADVRTFADTTVAGGVTYHYAVDAVDVAGNRSPRSEEVAVTTAAASGTITLSAVADAFVAEDSATSNYGGSTGLRVDAAPITSSYLRFDVPAGSVPVQRAVLRLYPTSSSSTGHEVRTVGDAWQEMDITYATAPAFDPAAPAPASGPFSSGAYVDVDVTGLAQAGLPLSLAVSGRSSTRIAYSSREGAHPPLLVLTY